MAEAGLRQNNKEYNSVFFNCILRGAKRRARYVFGFGFSLFGFGFGYYLGGPPKCQLFGVGDHWKCIFPIPQNSSKYSFLPVTCWVFLLYIARREAPRRKIGVLLLYIAWREAPRRKIGVFSLYMYG
jgi:hypothetical protein